MSNTNLNSWKIQIKEQLNRFFVVEYIKRKRKNIKVINWNRLKDVHCHLCLRILWKYQLDLKRSPLSLRLLLPKVDNRFIMADEIVITSWHACAHFLTVIYWVLRQNNKHVVTTISHLASTKGLRTLGHEENSVVYWIGDNVSPRQRVTPKPNPNPWTLTPNNK